MPICLYALGPLVAWAFASHPALGQEEREPLSFLTITSQQEEPSDITPQVPPTSSEGRLLLWARGGAWFIKDFEADTSNGIRKVSGASLPDLGLDFGYAFGHWAVHLSADWARSGDVSLAIGGLHVGATTLLPLEEILSFPVAAHFSMGVIAGHLEIDSGGFGDFEDAVGFQARLLFVTRILEGTGVSLWMDYRHIAFDYEEAVFSGDENAVESSFALGGSVVFRF